MTFGSFSTQLPLMGRPQPHDDFIPDGLASAGSYGEMRPHEPIQDFVVLQGRRAIDNLGESNRTNRANLEIHVNFNVLQIHRDCPSRGGLHVSSCFWVLAKVGDLRSFRRDKFVLNEGLNTNKFFDLYFDTS